MTDQNTLGRYLVRSVLPEGYKFDNHIVDAKTMTSTLKDLAQKDPKAYVQSVTELKKLGDEFATYEGVSVGLDDIEPNYKERDAIMDQAHTQIRNITDRAKRQDILLRTQDQLINLTKGHAGDMGLMARSGGRGNVPQLMKTVASPVVATDWDGKVIPWLVKRSYAEGLKPSELWITGGEARKNTIMGVTSVIEPGEVGKLMVQTMANQIVTQDDCGTTNGLLMSTSSADILDRYIAKPIGKFVHNTLITAQVADSLQQNFKQVTVRSPMTCEIYHGVCAKCYGLSTKGKPMAIGTAVGMQSAHALSEPLTQAMLSSKHAAGTAKGQTKELTGFKGVKLLLNVPDAFANAAVLASKPGIVSNIVGAPQGGHYVSVGDTKHYIAPDLKVTAVEGDDVEAGDALSEGVSKPNEVMAFKGLGVGRKYYADILHKVFKDSISNVDKRHVEMLAKSQLTHATVDDDPSGKLLRGDVVSYDTIKERLKDDAHTISLSDKASGNVLADNYFEYMIGTELTPKVIRTLKERGIKEVHVASNAPKLSFLMKPLTHSPLLNTDWMARLGHQYIKSSIMDAASYNESSDIHSTHPVPAFVYGTEFGRGKGGTY